MPITTTSTLVRGEDGKDYALFYDGAQVTSLEAQTLLVGEQPTGGDNPYIAVAADYCRSAHPDVDRAPWGRNQDITTAHDVTSKCSPQQIETLENKDWHAYNFVEASIDPENWMTLPGEGYTRGSAFPRNYSRQLE